MSFFHREFNSAIAEQDYIQQTHKHLISLVVELMKKYKDSSFESNRYGKIYIGLVVKYFEKYHSDASTGAIHILTVSGKKLAQIHSWEYLHSLAKWIMNSSFYPTTSLTIAFAFLMDRYKDDFKMVEIFEEVSNSLIGTYIHLNSYDAANDFASHFADSIQKLYLEDRSRWLCKYIASLFTLSKTFLLVGKLEESLGFINHAIDSYKGIPLAIGHCNSSYFYVLHQAGAAYSKNADYDSAIEFLKEAVELASVDYESDKNGWDERRVVAIGMLASIKMNTSSPMEELLELRDEAMSRSEKLFNLDNEKYVRVYVSAILAKARTLSCDGYFYSSEYSLIKKQNCNNIDPIKAHYSKLSTEVSLKAKEVINPFFKKRFLDWIEQYSESLMIPIDNLTNTCQNSEALKFAEILLLDIEPGKGIPVVDQMDLDLRQKKIRIYAGEGDRDKAYELYENVYQDLYDKYDKYDEENTTSLEALLNHLINSPAIFSEFKDWDASKKYLSLAKKMCAPRFKGNPDLWQKQYVEILYNYCGLLFTRFDKRLAYEVAIELNDILVRYGIYGVSKNTLVDRVIDDFKSTDAEYLLEQHQKNEIEHYENQAEEAFKAQELEYLDELSKTTLSNDNIKEIVDQEIRRFGNNANLNHLNVSAVTEMNELFGDSNFNGDISQWDVSSVESMIGMFYSSSFNGNISSWDTKNVKNMTGVFIGSDFNGNISQWDVSSVVFMGDLFRFTKFNGDLSRWDVSNVTDMRNMFESSTFNGDISQWNVSKVANMQNMFYMSQFNGDISSWDVSYVTDMGYMFEGAKFNGDISDWNVSNVTNMCELFADSHFDGDISRWDVSSVTDMDLMFNDTQFNGNISVWDVKNVKDHEDIFKDCPIAEEYKPDFCEVDDIPDGI
jgi:surface protein